MAVINCELTYKNSRETIVFRTTIPVISVQIVHINTGTCKGEISKWDRQIALFHDNPGNGQFLILVIKSMVSKKNLKRTATVFFFT